MRSRTATFVTLLVLGASVGIYLSLIGSNETSSTNKLNSKSAAQIMRRDLRERMYEYQATVTNVLERANTVTATVNNHDLKLVSSAARFAVRSLQDDEEAYNLTAKSRGDLNLLLGLSSMFFREFGHARLSLSNAVKSFDQSLTAYPDSDVLLAQAKAFNVLCCVNAKAGILEEAETAAKNSLEAAAQLQGHTEHADSASFERAHSLRSLAIIAAYKQQPALQYALGSLHAAETGKLLVRTEKGRISFERPDFILDCHLLLALIYSLEGDVPAAQREFQSSVDCIDKIQVALDEVSDFEEQPALNLRFRRLRTYLRIQLEKLNDRAVNSQDSLSNIGQYLWIPMRHQPGRSLHSDLLYAGTVSGEFENQDSIALLWRNQGWGHSTIVKVAVGLSSRVLTRIFVNDETSLSEIQSALKSGGADMSNVRFRVLPTDSIWIRDFGPLSSVTADNQSVLIDPIYGPSSVDEYRCNDEVLPERLGRNWDMPVVRTSLFIQGGEILVNGAGLCLVSRSLLGRNTLAGVSESFVLENLKRITGAKDIIVLESLIDEQTGHLDWFATFTSATTIFVGKYSDPSDPNTALLNRNADLLDGFMTTQGPLNVVRIPMPPRQRDWFGGSYTNVAYANGALLLPTWENDSSENFEAVVTAYREALPGWKIVSIPSDVLGERQGAIHCMTLGLPAINPLLD